MTPEQKRFTIHFFDARGNSVLGQDHLASENKRLVEENEILKRRLKAAVVRLREIAGDEANNATD